MADNVCCLSVLTNTFSTEGKNYKPQMKRCSESSSNTEITQQ